MSDYYSEKLSAEKLRKIYEIASPRIRQYLEAEINFVLDHIKPTDTVLELGCGYGRVLNRMAEKAALAIGIDTSFASLALAINSDQQKTGPCLCWMDALRLGFIDNTFDVVACIQNGISAFHVDQRQLIAESIRVTRPGGTVLFSTYSDKFWKERLQWFELQAQYGLLGEIDYDATGDGVIVCKDGFMATTVKPEQFMGFVDNSRLGLSIKEVDQSSLFYVLMPD